MSKRIRETEAETVAFVISQAIGLETGSAAQDYIQRYEGDAKLLTETLEDIQQTATHILNAIGADKISAQPAKSGLFSDRSQESSSRRRLRTLFSRSFKRFDEARTERPDCVRGKTCKTLFYGRT